VFNVTPFPIHDIDETFVVAPNDRGCLELQTDLRTFPETISKVFYLGDQSFTIQFMKLVRHHSSWKRNWNSKTNTHVLNVLWDSLDLQRYLVFPPPLEGNLATPLEYYSTSKRIQRRSGGEMTHKRVCCLLIAQQVEPIPMLGLQLTCDRVLDPFHLAVEFPRLFGPRWMTLYSPQLARLRFGDLTLPGTHNSGAYNIIHPFSAWIECQYWPIDRQLQYGIRTLDIRICLDGSMLYVSHEEFKTTCTVSRLLAYIRSFVDEPGHELELIILDFHRFTNLSPKRFDQLRYEIDVGLRGYCVPYGRFNLSSTLNEIWTNTSPRERVIVAWNHKQPLPLMWPGINQRWFDARSTKFLLSKIRSELENPPKGQLWSICSHLTPPVGINGVKTLAKRVQLRMERLFYEAMPFQTIRTNVISVDYFCDASQVVRQAVCSSLIKAALLNPSKEEEETNSVQENVPNYGL
jgi:hypothetical protein